MSKCGNFIHIKLGLKYKFLKTSKEMMMGRMLIYSDFDGTATSRAGEKTVFSTFYQSLLEGYKEGVRQHYITTPMKAADKVHSLFERKFGTYDLNMTPSKEDADLLMSPEAVLFFHEALKNGLVSVNFITKNRADYIKALFRYQGFSEEEISRLNIMDSRNKYDDVTKNILTQKDVTRIYVLDDSSDDFNKMTQAISDYGHTAEIMGHNEKAGTFQWTQYLAEIKTLIR